MLDIFDAPLHPLNVIIRFIQHFYLLKMHKLKHIFDTSFHFYTIYDMHDGDIVFHQNENTSLLSHIMYNT